MKVAAVQMKAALGDVRFNLEKARGLIREAFRQGCEMVILPEFFPTAVAFHPSLLKAAMPLEGPAPQLMREMAVEHGGYVGGSFIASVGRDNLNVFALAFPDGRYATHAKDQPTMWENCYYRGGKDEGILNTPLGPVGVALCWELVRTRTARRLRGRVDLLVGGSCWWTVPDRAIPLPGKRKAHLENLEVMRETPVRMARMVGVPVVHAAHAGEFTARMPLVPFLPYRSYFLGDTMIVGPTGEILAHLERKDGEGIAVAEVEPGRVEPQEEIPPGFWIPRLHPLIKLAWHYQNAHGRAYYVINKRLGRIRTG